MFNTAHIRKCFGWIIIPLWTSAMCVVVASLMVGHWVTLPHPAQGTKLQVAQVNENPSVDSTAGHVTLHFLYSDCPCSRRVLKRVLQRRSIENANERIVLVGEDRESEQLAIKQGFEIDVVSPKELRSKYGVESTPLLVITQGDGTICYSGGYTSRKQGLDFQDQEIIARTINGESVPGLPLYGCAVSKGLQAIVDPLHLKY